MNYPNPGYAPTQQYPPQPPQQPQYPGYPPAPQGYPQAAPQQFPQQGYPQAAPQAPAVPLAKGSIDDYYGQPSVGGGPSISWTDKQGGPKPIGTTYGGIVARDVTDADIQQQTDFRTQAPLTYRDGRPKFAMKIPLKVQPSEEYPEGEATWFVKGQARDELVRAMKEAGVTGAPQQGAVIIVTLVQRRPSGPGMNPANVVQVQYQAPGGAGQSQAPVQVQQPEQQAPAQQFVQQPPAQAPAQQFQPQVPQQQYAQPAPQQVAQPQFQAPAQQPIQQQAPAQAAAPQAPADFNAEQQQLLAKLTGQQPAA